MRRVNLRYQRIRTWLQKTAPEGLVWPWIQDEKGRPLRRLTAKRANKFLLGCILDYQIKAEAAWFNAERLAENVLGDPQDIWKPIARQPAGRWQAQRERLKWLHRFPAAHMRVWKIARNVERGYEGDAREIWRGRPAAEVKRRFLALGLGNQISRMAVGALMDAHQVKGSGDLKADVHVCRVLGRLLVGTTLTPSQATEEARRISPKNPWKLDRPLYMHGKATCGSRPRCRECEIKNMCRYYEAHGPRGHVV